MTPVIFRGLVHSELSTLPLTRTQIIEAMCFFERYRDFQHFNCSRSLVLRIWLCAFARFPVVLDYTLWSQPDYFTPGLEAPILHKLFPICLDEFAYLLKDNFILGQNRYGSERSH